MSHRRDSVTNVPAVLPASAPTSALEIVQAAPVQPASASSSAPAIVPNKSPAAQLVRKPYQSTTMTSASATFHQAGGSKMRAGGAPPKGPTARTLRLIGARARGRGSNDRTRRPVPPARSGRERLLNGKSGRRGRSANRHETIGLRR